VVYKIDFDTSFGKIFFTTYANRYVDDIFKYCDWNDWAKFLIDLGEANL